MAVIEVRDLVKDYAGVRAVDGISFSVQPGEIYALLGHNGAGKSTTVEILEGHRKRSAGHVSVLGHDPASRDRELRDRIGIVLQTSGIEEEFTVREAIDIYGSAYRRRRDTTQLAELVGLDAKLDDRIGTLSGGQQRRLDLALGIVGYTELLLLDEPTTGFDPAARRATWALIESLTAEGLTVLLTTHYLDEAERLANRVGILAHGELVAEGPPRQLISQLGRTRVAFTLPSGVSAGELSGRLPESAVIDGERVEFVTADPTGDLHRITGWAVERGVELGHLAVTRSSLEDVFLELGSADGDGPDTGQEADHR